MPVRSPPGDDDGGLRRAGAPSGRAGRPRARHPGVLVRRSGLAPGETIAGGGSFRRVRGDGREADAAGLEAGLRAGTDTAALGSDRDRRARVSHRL